MMHDLPDLTGTTIAFDLDGTLVDTAPDLVGTMNAVLAEQGLPTLPFDQVMSLVGRGAWALVQRGFAAAGEPLDEDRKPELFGRFIEIYTGRIADESRPYPGCLAALDALAGAGATLAVCTNKLTGLSVQLLDALEMTSRFAAVVGPDAAPAAKPDPRHIAAAVMAAGGRLDRSLMVGDSITDFNAARATGVPVLLVPFGYSEVAAATLSADAFCETWDEIPMACARLLQRHP
jgi:phosphoglycolate phosphatase